MKVLYAIQGTGNGHLSRAFDIAPCLQKRAEVDILVSGTQADLKLPFEVKYRLTGLSFVFGKAGGVDLWATFMKARIRRLISEINALPVENYDLVISDFEPVSAWACNLRDKLCIGLSHQVGALDPMAPKAQEVDLMGRFIMKNYAPTPIGYGFHFRAYSPQTYTPLIRQQIRQLKPSDRGHYTVYLPAYDDQRLLENLSQFPDTVWHVFSKHNKTPVSYGNVTVRPIESEPFVESLAHSRGVLCGAGFETPAEALFLGKKLMVIPMKNQYEQHLNAVALTELGIPILPSLNEKHYGLLRNWLDEPQYIAVNYPDQTQSIVDEILNRYGA